VVDRKKVHVIVNPHAGHGRAGKKWPLILDYLQTLGFDVTWQMTERQWHAYHIAKEYMEKGAQLLVSVGGEGVLNEILNGVFAAARTSAGLPCMAMIPIGTGTDLSRTLHIPKEYHGAVDIVKHGRELKMDVGRITFYLGNHTWSRYFINASDAGLGGAVARITNTIPKVLGGFLTFLLSSLVGLLSFKRMKLKLTVDGKPVDSGLMTIVGILNGQFFGGGMQAAPMAVVDDGILEFIYVKDATFFKVVTKVLAKVYEGEHLAYHKVHACRGKELIVEGQKVFLADVDGEVEKAQKMRVEVLPKAIRILVKKD
jgi:YegS/Rv2252/BmrU family lipid kinase